MDKYEVLQKFKKHKNKIIENINAARDMNINKITAILIIDEEDEEVQKRLINWLIIDGYKVSLRRDEYSVLTIEW